jgi:UDP-N-acetylmuramate dehydrogenase
VFNDKGFNGLVILDSINELGLDGEMVTVAAGTMLTTLLELCIDNSLSGLEWAGGLPGTVGGAVRGNAGAYGGETKDNVVEVESINLNTLEKMTRSKDQCNFSYRSSIYKLGEGENEIITRIKFMLKKGNKDEIKKLTQEKINARILRHPLAYPNVGSIFKNVEVEKFSQGQMRDLSVFIKNDPFPVIPTAKINFLAGLSGTRVGDAQLSTKHTNFIINLGNAKSQDVKKLIKIIKKTVKEKFNVDLEEEVMFVD